VEWDDNFCDSPNETKQKRPLNVHIYVKRLLKTNKLHLCFPLFMF